MVHNFNLKKHTELCQKAFKYMDGQTCLICEIEFNTITDIQGVRGQSGFFNLVLTERIMQVEFNLKLSGYSSGVDI